MNNLDAMRGLQGPSKLSTAHKSQKSTNADGPNFKDTLAGVIKDVNSMQNKADVSIEKMAAGEITDVHQVMNSVEEAKTAFNMMMEIRGKVMDAYKEVMNMRL